MKTNGVIMRREDLISDQLHRFVAGTSTAVQEMSGPLRSFADRGRMGRLFTQASLLPTEACLGAWRNPNLRPAPMTPLLAHCGPYQGVRKSGGRTHGVLRS